MKSQFSQYVVLPGSYKKQPTGIQSKSIGKDRLITVSIRLQPKTPLPDLLSENNAQSFAPPTRAAFYEKYSARPEDIRQITDFAHMMGLSIVKADARTRTVQLRGTSSQLAEAFKVSLQQYEQHGKTFYGRSGNIQVPQELAGIIEGVFGLDDRDAATPKFQARPHTATTTSFNPNELATLYHYPQDATGKAQTIAIIELGGGYKTADLNNYFKGLNRAVPKVVAISVDGAHNAPTTADSADGEVLLDIEVAGAIAPDATLAVYFAPNSDQGFLDAITQAIHNDTYPPSVISISWGAAEVNWTQQSLQSFNKAFQEAATLGITVCAAAGDTGSNDSVNDGKAHADFPASSPYVLACGGTKLTVTDGKITQEVTWHESNDSATGGGVSEVFPLPDYQSKAQVPVSVNTQKPGRGLPDVAALADPETGYNVLVDGQRFVIGGTSAVAPLMAGLLALINEKLQKNAGFIHPKLYAQPSVCRDITEGDNITVAGNKGYRAGPGWDACSGLGVPDGTALLKALA
ncbi:kumamolisin. Serine peptidase. MEROPS family S53 [Chitinophaga costaii]|uniref:Kumamolisin. Serine peptidase. MEROPS family S53 n=1 Tax=Chitinophaga costaii TaxID=1335309 RepID=A0A1C4G2S3_9BACT|nr:S53 family peptidase [Chitinophaga costaii]PUZ19764.1 peptidase S53 [Chitinophaga costaii]SCC62175.1 kumamolisin. Serine peptidase. MEROPS family S53 [Chitinophaga costaii]